MTTTTSTISPQVIGKIAKSTGAPKADAYQPYGVTQVGYEVRQSAYGKYEGHVDVFIHFGDNVGVVTTAKIRNAIKAKGYTVSPIKISSSGGSKRYVHLTVTKP